MSARFSPNPLLSLMFLVVAMFLAGCGSNPPLTRSTEAPPVYLLAPGDSVKVTVFGEESLSGDHVVTAEGDISLPLLGDVPVAGKSLSQVRSVIVDKLSPDYLADPRVSVEVLNYRPIYVLGEVENAGEYKYSANLTATQAIALAGGYTYRADRGRVFIRRSYDGAERTFELSTERPVWIMPGDTIRVGERYF